MSLPSGVGTSQEVKKVFGSAVKDGLRWIQIKITGEDTTLSVTATGKIGGDLDSDLDSMASSATTACYYLVVVNPEEQKWIFVLYVPDTSSVRDKMLYASTRDTLKKDLGYSHFIDELQGTVKDDINSKGYSEHKTMIATAAPLTAAEKAAKSEALSAKDISTTTYVHSVSFPLSSGVKSALESYQSESAIAVVTRVEAETIELSSELNSNSSITTLAATLPKDEPRFIVLRFEHKLPSNAPSTATSPANFFIYYCPETSKVKDKMIASSAKSALLSQLSAFDITDTKNLEISSSSELTEKELMNELYPPVLTTKKFSKPARPGKGGARLIKK